MQGGRAPAGGALASPQLFLLLLFIVVFFYMAVGELVDLVGVEEAVDGLVDVAEAVSALGEERDHAIEED